MSERPTLKSVVSTRRTFGGQEVHPQSSDAWVVKLFDFPLCIQSDESKADDNSMGSRCVEVVLKSFKSKFTNEMFVSVVVNGFYNAKSEQANTGLSFLEDSTVPGCWSLTYSFTPNGQTC